MNQITNYIKERIETLKNTRQGSITMTEYNQNKRIIAELQAVLSKIEEGEKEEIADARGENFFNDRN